MIRLFVSPPEFLKRGRLVKFVGDFNSDITDGTLVEIEQTNLINFRKGYIVPEDDRVLVDFSNYGTKLYPTEPDSLYEILIGFKTDGEFIIHPQLPAGHYIWRLEEATMYPDAASPSKRWIGAIKPSDSPVESPKLRIHTLKDMEPLYFEIQNVGTDYGKIILDLSINQCLFRKLSKSETQGYELIYREVVHPSEYE